MPLQYITKQCPQCGKSFTIPIGNRRQVCCSAACSYDRRRRPLSDRFWEKVRKTDQCWEWTAARYPGGYGVIDDESAHRTSWILHFGPIPSGMRVLHRCDNRLCVRPDHLFLGTAKENTADMLQKGREARGGMLPHTKLSAGDVRDIRASIEPGDVLAARYGVTESSISMIRSRKTWKHVK